MSTPIIAYYRVSTAKQGASGLGLEAQQQTVQEFARTHGRVILKSYQEVESGRKASRPELAKAIGHAKLAGATLVIAKLDRLSRNVAFLSNLMEAKVDFVACDNPHATPFTLHILAAVAEHEAKQISQRTKDALKAYKARGGRMGTPANLTPDARAKGAKQAALSRTQGAAEAYGFLAPTLMEWKGMGLTQTQIAARLNDEGHRTRTGKTWNQGQVSRVLQRIQ